MSFAKGYQLVVSLEKIKIEPLEYRIAVVKAIKKINKRFGIKLKKKIL